MESLATLAAFLLLHASAAGQATTRVSVDSAGLEGNGASSGASASADGRLVAFQSSASNLVPGDTNGWTDVFVHDRQTGLTRRVSVDSAGAQANQASGAPAISADGRCVAFHSLASNLVAGDANGHADVFVHDLQTGLTVRVSVSSTGAEARNFSFAPAISADGSVIAFHSIAGNLVPGDTNTVQDVFAHDRRTGATVRVSVASSGAQANSFSGDASISADGTVVAFQSLDASLVPGDTNGMQDVFVHELATGLTRRVSVDGAGLQGNFASSDPSLSADGLRVAFRSDATNLVPADTNAVGDAFVHELLTGATVRVSVDSAGAQGNGASAHPTLSADGRWAAFASSAGNLVPGDGNGVQDAFLHDRLSGATIRVSVDSAGAQADGSSSAPAITAHGSEIVFTSSAADLVPGDGNGFQDVFVHDRGAFPALAASGSCGAALTVTITGATPLMPVALLFGPAGAYAKPGPPCQGILLSLAAPHRAGAFTADGAGTVVQAFNLPPGACGKTLQAVDVATCQATNAILL